MASGLAEWLPGRQQGKPPITMRETMGLKVDNRLESLRD
jgi:hypothetical protein